LLVPSPPLPCSAAPLRLRVRQKDDAPADSRPRLACHTPDLCVSLRGFAASRETIQPAQFPNGTDVTAQCSGWKARATENKTAAGAIQTDSAAAQQNSSQATHPRTPVRGSPATHQICAFPFAASRLRVRQYSLPSSPTTLTQQHSTRAGKHELKKTKRQQGQYKLTSRRRVRPAATPRTRGLPSAARLLHTKSVRFPSRLRGFA
jgi:hypothetical protein